MSFTKTPKGKAPTASYPNEDTITVLESRPQTHLFRSKGKNTTRNSLTEGSSVTQTKFLSSTRAVDEGTPAYSVVEDVNDQLSDKGIQRLPKDLEAARQEITALRATNQELLQQSVTPEQGNYRKQGKKRSKHRQHPRRNTKS